MKTLLFILLLIPQLANACERYVIGFKGINNVFDEIAFRKYAIKHKACTLSYGWNQYKIAIKFINSNTKQYQLYGFSKGAESVGKVLKEVKRKPYKVVTFGAYHTANVNYQFYNVPTQNFFDRSGSRNLSKGIHIKNVDHEKIQSYVNIHYFGIK
jgi:hypothetical protein